MFNDREVEVFYLINCNFCNEKYSSNELKIINNFFICKKCSFLNDYLFKDFKSKYDKMGHLFNKLINIERKHPFCKDKIKTWIKDIKKCPCRKDFKCFTNDPNLTINNEKKISCSKCYRARLYENIFIDLNLHFHEKSRGFFYIFLHEELKKILKKS